MQLSKNAEKKTVKVWEVEDGIPLVEVQEKRKRQRQSGARDHGARDPAREMPSRDQVATTADTVSEDSFYFCFYVRSNGIILQIGSLYSLNFVRIQFLFVPVF